MLVAKDEGEFYSVFKSNPFLFSEPISNRIHFYFDDRYAVWDHLPKNQPAERIDLFIAEPGNYRIKYALRDPSSRMPIGVESNEITVSVVPVDPGDSILKVLQEKDLESLGEKFYSAFYFGSAGVNFGRGESRREFLPVLREIIEDCTDSAYYKAASICHALSAGRKKSVIGNPIADPYSKAFAEQFLKRFPESWFRVEVGETLIQTYLYEGDTDRALATYNLLIAEQPNSVLLKNRNIEKRIDERIQTDITQMNPVKTQTHLDSLIFCFLNGPVKRFLARESPKGTILSLGNVHHGVTTFKQANFDCFRAT